MYDWPIGASNDPTLESAGIAVPVQECFGDLVLFSHLDQRAVVAHTPAERHLAAQVAATLPLVTLHFSYPFARATALGLPRPAPRLMPEHPTSRLSAEKRRPTAPV